MDTNLILAISQIAAVTVIPIMVWGLGILWQNRKTRQEAKVNLFTSLMRNRDIHVDSREWIESLNMIDIIFQDERKVREAWRAYHDSLNENSTTHGSKDVFKIELLSEIAKSLGYNELRQTEIAWTYKPKGGYKKKLKEEKILREEWLRVITSSKSLSSDMTEEEYQKHKNELGL